MTASRFAQRPELLWLLAAAAVLLCGLSWASWTVFAKYRQAASWLAETEPRHARMAGLLHSQPELAAASAQIQANLRAYVYPAEDEPSHTANTALQRVRELAARHDLRVSSSQTSAPREENGFDRIGLNLRIEGTWPGVLALLGDLATLQPAIYYNSLQLGSRGRGASDDDTGFVQLDLYLLKERQP